MKVSIGIIALNEEKNLPTIFDNILNQTYPLENIELILVDGMSTDNSKVLMSDFQKDYSSKFLQIKLFDNPKRIQAAGWNIVIENSECDVIIRLDAHAIIPCDFVSENIACIKSGEEICGGTLIQKIDSDRKISKVCLTAETSMFGGSPASFRRNGKKEYVKTLALGCYKKEVFETVGLFNENLLRSEDNEMHFRIRKNGYKICLSDNISYEYFIRPTLNKMVKQKYGNGKWIGITSVKLTPSIFSWYHFIPLLFVLGMISCIITACVGFAFPLWTLWFCLPLIIVSGMYFILIEFIALVEAIRGKSLLNFLLLPLIICCLHISYGFGTFVGVLLAPFKRFVNY